MNAGRIFYRSRQFWAAMFSAPCKADLEAVSAILSPAQMSLFRQMHPSEQAHSIRVMQALYEKGRGIPEAYRHDLLVAALLHDAGKSLHPLHLWERVGIVLVRKLSPTQAQRWGSGAPTGWRRAFTVAEGHPEWGAQLAERAGASPLTVELIRRHQERVPEGSQGVEGQLLHLLQSVDHES